MQSHLHTKLQIVECGRLVADLHMDVFGDTAVVTGTVDETAENATHHDYVWTDVFVKRGGKWLAVASQTALVK